MKLSDVTCNNKNYTKNYIFLKSDKNHKVDIHVKLIKCRSHEIVTAIEASRRKWNNSFL